MNLLLRWFWLAVVLASPWVALCVAQWVGWHLRPATDLGVLWALVGSPCLEEVVYRLGVQRPVWAYCEEAKPVWNPWGAGRTASVVATVTFVVVHVPAHGWFALAWAVPAAVLSELFRQTRQAGHCMALHAWFNASLWWASA